MSLRTRLLSGEYLEVTQMYNEGVHNGIDVVGKNYTCDYIRAHSKGVVIGVRKDCNNFENGSYGNYVLLDHGNGYQTLYGHMKYGSVHVNVGDSVSRSEVIGYMGNTGESFGAHLHFEVRHNGTRIDPYPYINSDLPNTYEEPEKDVETLAHEVIEGKYGNGEERKQALGSRYSEVQARVNEILAPSPEPTDDILDLVRKTIRGDFGNGEERKQALGENYTEVQREVNLNFENGTTSWDNIKLY